MNFWGITDEDDRRYCAQESVAYATAEGLEDQNWSPEVGGFVHAGLRRMAEYRRLDFGLLNPCADGVLAGDGNVPARMWYPPMSKRSTVQTGLQRLMPARRIRWKQNSGGTSTKTLHLLIQESPQPRGFFCLVMYDG